MAENSTTTIVMVLVFVVILCSSCSSGVTVAANEFPSFGGSFLDFLRGDWYTNIFGEKKDTTVTSNSSDPGGSTVSGNNDDDGDDKKDYKNNCMYLYKDKDGKKYVTSKCTKDKETYKSSKLDGVSSIRVGKDLTVYLYDKKDKEKKYKGKNNNVYNLSGNWNNDTKKIVIQHEDYKSSGSSSKDKTKDKPKDTAVEQKSKCAPYPWGVSVPGHFTTHTRRQLQSDGTYKCPPHWKDTGCGWDDPGSQERQCAIKVPIV